MGGNWFYCRNHCIMYKNIILYVVHLKLILHLNYNFKKLYLWDFPGSAVVKNPPANAGDTDLIPGLGRSHVPQNN